MSYLGGFPGWLSGKESAPNVGDAGSIPGSVRKILWRRKWQPTPVFMPGKFYGQRRLAGYSPRGHRELDTTERLHFTSSKYCISDSFVDHDGYSISSEGFLPAVVDIMVI